MSILKEKFAKKVPEIRDRYKNMVKEHGAVKLAEVSVATLYGGLRGVKGMVCDTSSVPPDRGLLIRGRPIGELTDKLPEEIFYLLLTGELPNKEELAALQKDFAARAKVPEYVWNVLRAMPKTSHPMAMFNTAILVLENESKFRARYDAGMKKDDYWDAAFEDAMDINAKLPEIGAFVYRLRFDKGAPIASDPNLDWGANFARMTGLPDPNGEFTKLMRLYFTLHCDHEGGNVSAFSAHTIGSALSDQYYALSGGLNGLAGPLHGLANQECLGWILETNKKFGGSPSEEQLEKFAQETLDAGRVVPGYGHAVLRITDPRFTAFYDFGAKYCPDDPAYKTMARVFKVVPEVLKKVQKIKDPWPNVDAASGSLLYHYGMVEFPYYTVLFSISRAMGITAQHIVSRAMGSPIVRPKSMTGEELDKAIAAAAAK
ncbi:MAG: citrate (Si)-synthase [Deltaproteobacteria bacterium]|nr:citrate (Si)-synthase [Deltaproteobacteria bacterium]